MEPARIGEQGGTPKLGDRVTDETATAVVTAAVPAAAGNGAAEHAGSDIDGAIALAVSWCPT